MATNPSPGLGDLLGLFGGANPLAGISRSAQQFQTGVQQFLSTVENFNGTLEELNRVARRLNGLLDTMEEPINAFVPQVTRTIKAADTMVTQLSATVDKVAPGLSRLADTLSSPVLTSLPTDLESFIGVLGDLARRLQPLGQMAESAGSLFGFRPLAALRSGGRRPTSSPSATAPRAAPTPSRAMPDANRPAAKKPSPKKPPAAKPAAATTATKPAARRAAVKSPAAQRSTAKKSTAKKSTARR
jgi:ABC-type transporter Mla subunit MlaD